jgi:hypothetical protein
MHSARSALAMIASLLRAGQREMLTQGIQQCGAGIQRQRMRAAVDLKLHRGGRWGRSVVIDRTGGKSGTRKRGQEQRGGPGLDHRAAGNLDCRGFCIGFLLVHDCSIFAGRRRPPAGRQEAYGQVSSGRLMTMGVAVLRTTTHRNGSSFEELISMCGRKAGT